MIRSLYKSQEPFMLAPDAHGYLGVVMYDDVTDTVQCHICGKWFADVGSHAFHSHKVYARDYKQMFGFTLRTALCSKKRSWEHSQTILKNPEIQKKACNLSIKANRDRIPRPTYNGKGSIQMKNKYGCCDLQLKARYDIVKKCVLKDPLTSDLLKFDRRLPSLLIARYGNLNKARVVFGDKTRVGGYSNPLPDLDMLASLRRFAVENKRLPTPKDFKSENAPGDYCFGRSSYYRHFGSWSNALRTAGLK